MGFVSDKIMNLLCRILHIRQDKQHLQSVDTNTAICITDIGFDIYVTTFIYIHHFYCSLYFTCSVFLAVSILKRPPSISINY